MRIGRFILASTIATVSALLVSSAAHAAKVVPLKSEHTNVTAEGFETHECTGPFEDLEPNEDGWHFILPDSVGDDFTSVTITFSGGVVAGPITSTDANNPDSGSGWVGFLDATGSGDVKHAYVITTPAGLTLLSGTSLVEPTTPAGGEFNLSHTCPGTPATPSPSTPASPSKPVPSGGAETGGGGSYTTAVLGLGALALAGGAGVLLFRIRRRDELA